MTDEELVVIRIRKSLRERLVNLAKKKDTTLTALTNDAAEVYLQENEYTFQDFLDVLKNHPTLRVYVEMIKKEFTGCPSNLCKTIIDIIKGRNAQILSETFDTINEKIESFEKKKIHGIFLHFSMLKPDIRRVNDTLASLQEFVKLGIISGADIHEVDKAEDEKVLLFISYKKEGEDAKK